MLTLDLAAARGLRLHDLLDAWACEQPNAEFAVFGDRRLTYLQAQTAANQFARAIVDAGCAPAARIAVLARNCLEYALVYFAASKAGVVVVPLNYRSAPAEWAYVLNDSAATLLIAAEEFAGAVQRIRNELVHLKTYISLDTVDREWLEFGDWVGAQPSSPPERNPSPADDVCQLYTSGTTGTSRGAMLTHQAIISNLVQIGASAHGVAPGERSLVAAPMLHAGVVWSSLAPLARGGALYILESFDAPSVVRILDRERIGYAVLVPTMLQACVGVPGAAEGRYESLRVIHTGSAPLSLATLQRARSTFRCTVLQGYGLTEATAAVTAMEPIDYERALGGRPELMASVGRPLLGTQVRIVDEHDRPLPAGTPGEIVVRGPQLMRGYWNKPRATDDAMRGGWLHTGDVGHLDADGYLFITDRLKDMIVSGGINVYPRMVERVLEAHPAVAEVAVIGVPDGHWGESVKAVVVPRAGVLATEQEVIDFARDRLGGFQTPRSVDFVSVLPRTASGKVLKRELREPFWSDRTPRVGEA
jgi:acyl-CoA synthetase (AMP-forming)/AMP-acid ligase II